MPCVLQMLIGLPTRSVQAAGAAGSVVQVVVANWLGRGCLCVSRCPPAHSASDVLVGIRMTTLSEPGPRPRGRELSAGNICGAQMPGRNIVPTFLCVLCVPLCGSALSMWRRGPVTLLVPLGPLGAGTSDGWEGGCVAHGATVSSSKAGNRAAMLSGRNRAAQPLSSWKKRTAV